MIRVRVPGDKSLTHRALLFGALGEGESRVGNPLPGEDCRSTVGALRAMGVGIPSLPVGGGEIRFRGVGLQGLHTPTSVLDVGNSGTTARLLLGVLAGQPGMVATITGDASLRSRPMRRVTDPLASMGARFKEMGEEGRLPVEVSGGPLRYLDYPSPVASAQVKSSILLAGLVAGVPVAVTEPRRSRDHTERLLAEMGSPTIGHHVSGGWRVELRDPPSSLSTLDFAVPGDFSSAAFLTALGLLGGAGEGLVIEDVSLNPTRTGLLRVLERMAPPGSVTVTPGGPSKGGGAGGAEVVEPRGTITVVRGALDGVRVDGDEIPDMVDEVPILAVLAARAQGETVITGAGELRVKESDRISALATNLTGLGVFVEEFADGLVIRGTDRPLRGRARSFGDHRIAMAFGVLGALPGNEIEVEAPHLAEVSFPGFWETLRTLVSGPARRTPASRPSRHTASDQEPVVVTIDGPAGSGKSTTAQAVAERLGYRHLDSGAIYRALTLALLEEGIPREEWESLELDRLKEIPLAIAPEGRELRIALGDRVLTDELRSERVTSAVSEAAKVPAVRARLLDLQREAGRAGGLVADGRDMGTVVFPDAQVKVFLIADLEERARRRLIQTGTEEPDPETIRSEAERIQTRDAIDSTREASPLARPEGAMDLDTTDLTFEEQVDAIVQRVKELTTP